MYQKSMANRSNRVRSSSQSLTMSSDDDDHPKLPHDVAVEILKRLPVGSLLRFRCVCRSWRSTIDDPRFVALHLSHSALDASNWHLACVDLYDPVQSLCSLFSGESLARPSLSQIEIPFAAPPNCYGFVGSCNGLICVTDISEDRCGRTMYLWNLFTRKHKAIPESDFLSMEHVHIVLGFGFDARWNDYKIVRIIYYPYEHPQGFGKIKPQVDIYSLWTDSWRSLECEVPTFCSDRPPAFSNGNLHWFVFKHNDLQEYEYGSILLFDVASEVFDEMALPEKLLHVVSVGLDVFVSVLNDLLAVIILHENAFRHPDVHCVSYVWVMRDYGVPESWTKLYTFNPSALVTGFDCFTWNGELLMLISGGERVSWNPITGQLANFPLSRRCELVTVVESLVSL
ncbi:F-box/kelch-repeat protein At3g23880-like [Syzygium oleosum]|uniref:F-box/kelch-repeat protein At3g23880-like n=1 Tax=Syzygium oleosum TaxID=219896 RepID=UPI0024B9F7F7|nr:F-box/kelch-repeat protein At3g23880-like [Syzygium oleosum]